jgi:hypothetical protein
MTTFLWTGSDMVQCGKSLVTWHRVQWGGGGGGVLDLRLLSIAL